MRLSDVSKWKMCCWSVMLSSSSELWCRNMFVFVISLKWELIHNNMTGSCLLFKIWFQVSENVSGAVMNLWYQFEAWRDVKRRNVHLFLSLHENLNPCFSSASAGSWNNEAAANCSHVWPPAAAPARPIRSLGFGKTDWKLRWHPSAGLLYHRCGCLASSPALHFSPLYIFKCPFHAEHKEERLEVEKRNLQLFPVNIFPLLGSNERSRPFTFKRA